MMMIVELAFEFKQLFFFFFVKFHYIIYLSYNNIDFFFSIIFKLILFFFKTHHFLQLMQLWLIAYARIGAFASIIRK